MALRNPTAVYYPKLELSGTRNLLLTISLQISIYQEQMLDRYKASPVRNGILIRIDFEFDSIQDK